MDFFELSINYNNLESNIQFAILIILSPFIPFTSVFLLVFLLR